MTTSKPNNIKAKLTFLYIILALGLGAMGYFGFSLLQEMRITNQSRALFQTTTVDIMPRNLVNTASPQAAPAPAQPFVSFVDFDAKRTTFPNIVGWIQSEGTVINYPIVQARDNDFYLNHLPDGTRNQIGSIFLDYRNNADFSDHITIIYGHDMRSRDKFGSLRYYESQAYFDQHSTMFIFTPYQDYKLRIFAGYVLDSSYEVPPMSFANEEEFYGFIEMAKDRSLFTSDVEVSYDDRLMVLATCTPTGSQDLRLVIIGILTEI